MAIETPLVGIFLRSFEGLTDIYVTPNVKWPAAGRMWNDVHESVFCDWSV